MRWLAKLKRLRGTSLDIFGWTHERRRERELIGWYELLLDQIVARLRSEPPQALLEIASAPLEIR